MILVVENDCIECKNYQEQLNNNGIGYMKVNKSKDTNYELILNELNMSYDDVTSPSIIYVKNKKVVSTLTNMKTNEEINSFIVNYKLEGNGE